MRHARDDIHDGNFTDCAVVAKLSITCADDKFIKVWNYFERLAEDEQ